MNDDARVARGTTVLAAVLLTVNLAGAEPAAPLLFDSYEPPSSGDESDAAISFPEQWGCGSLVRLSGTVTLRNIAVRNDLDSPSGSLRFLVVRHQGFNHSDVWIGDSVTYADDGLSWKVSPELDLTLEPGDYDIGVVARGSHRQVFDRIPTQSGIVESLTMNPIYRNFFFPHVETTHGAADCAIRLYGTPCGDGVVDDGEDCDDGERNGTPASCCDATCGFEPAGTVCDDDDVCTIGESCSAGTCGGGDMTLREPLTDVDQTVACLMETLDGIGTP